MLKEDQPFFPVHLLPALYIDKFKSVSEIGKRGMGTNQRP